MTMIYLGIMVEPSLFFQFFFDSIVIVDFLRKYRSSKVYWRYRSTFTFTSPSFPRLAKALHKGWGLSAKLGKHSAIWGKLGTALQAYALNPCTKFAPNPTSRKVNT